MTTPKMSAAAAKFWADQKAADEAYKKWEDQQWQENGQEWTKQGYTRTVDPNHAWGSTWTKSNQPIVETKITPPPVDPIKPALVSKTTAQWDALAAEKSGGKYKTMAEVRALQQQMQNAGIDIGKYGADGKWGDDTQKAYDVYLASQNTPKQITSPGIENPIDYSAWRNHMSGLGYTEVDGSDGTVHFTDGNGNVYYSNGRMWSDSQMGNYDYTTLSKLQPKTNTQYDEYTTNLLKGGKDAYRGSGEMSSHFNILFGRYLIDKYGKDTFNKYNRLGDWDKHEDYMKLWDLYKNQFNVDNTSWQQRPLFGYKKYIRKNKNGGIMNRINYFQQGGAAPQQDIQQQVTALVQAAMQGDQKATQTVNQIMEAAKAGDQQATQLAQLIQQVVQQMKGQATAAKWGSKLNYIRSLKYAKGGKTCSACQNGGMPVTSDKAYIKSNKKVEEKACGGKAKKHQEGGFLSSKTYPEAKYGFITREQIPTRKGNVMIKDLDNTPRRVILEKTRRMPNGEFVNDTLYFRNKSDQNKALLPRYGMSDPNQLRYKFGALDYFGNPKETPNKTAFESYLK